MTLPYPREVETGKLVPRQPEPRVAFDVKRAVEDAIVARGAHVELFGVPFVVADAAGAEALVERHRQAVLSHFNERVAAPDASLWQRLAERVHAQLERHAELDDGALQVLRLSIDNL